MTVSPMVGPTPRRDVLWQDCRNSLGIARLLVTEDRPQPFVATACRMAVENACRAALEQAGMAFDGDLGRSLQRLGTPTDVRELETAAAGQLLTVTETVVARVAAHLRQVAPERSWGF